MKSNDGKLKKGAVSAKSAAAEQKPRNPDNWRETIESVVVAFVLAFLFRTFEAEAFVIPTGSMAPTLYGQHRDVYCSQCGTRFAVGVKTVGSIDSEIRDGEIVHNERSHFAICANANCRFPNDILDHEMFAGDRILVNKFPYEFNDPERWDVVVFKFPEQAKTNYIKRLVGKPGEEVRIEHGDVKVRDNGSDANVPFRIARKPPEKQRRLQLLVHDNDHPARQLLESGWPESWANEETSGWEADTEARSFRVDPDATDSRLHWLRYTHYLPRADDWNRVLAGKAPHRPQAQHITDFYAYNARIKVSNAKRKMIEGDLPEFDPLSDNPHSQPQWVGDLTLTCRVEVFATGGELVFELIEGSRLHQCRIDLETGRGQFVYVHEMDVDGEDPRPAGEPFDTGMNHPGRYAVSFANVDDRLCLWVDDRLVKPLEFDPNSKFEPQKLPLPTERDKSPVGIAARMAQLRVDHLRVERDIYYTSNELDGRDVGQGRVYRLKKDDEDPSHDEFLMLGDNSPQSNDSRMWGTTHAVPRHLLIGKAFFVYWPHGVPFLNGGRGYPIGKYHEPPPPRFREDRDDETGPSLPKFSLPFYPQVGRMHRIR
jgi:signal peptidase I